MSLDMVLNTTTTYLRTYNCPMLHVLRTVYRCCDGHSRLQSMLDVELPSGFTFHKHYSLQKETAYTCEDGSSLEKFAFHTLAESHALAPDPQLSPDATRLCVGPCVDLGTCCDALTGL